MLSGALKNSKQEVSDMRIVRVSCSDMSIDRSRLCTSGIRLQFLIDDNIMSLKEVVK